MLAVCTSDCNCRVSQSGGSDGSDGYDGDDHQIHVVDLQHKKSTKNRT